MPLDPFITFQKFSDPVAALDLGSILEEANIEYLLEDYSLSFDASFANNEMEKEYRIKIKKEDFGKADNLMQQVSLSQIDLVDKDYYLFDFTDEELMEVIAKRDEWGYFNFVLAQKLLKERGKEIRPETVKRFEKQRKEELATPEESGEGWIYAGYAFAFLGGLVGLFIGWHLWLHKKTLPDGERVYGYSETSRMHGKRIAIMGFIFSMFWLSVKALTHPWHLMRL